MLLSGCSGDSVPIKTDNLSFGFKISHDGSVFNINAEVEEPGEMKFTVVSPENIKGLTFEFSKEAVHIEFLGLKKDFPRADTDFGVLGQIYNAFSALHGAEAVKDGDDREAIVMGGEQKFIFTVTDLGIPIALSFDDNKIEFKNITSN